MMTPQNTTMFNAPTLSGWAKFHRLFKMKTTFRFIDGSRMTKAEAIEHELLPRIFKYKYISDPFVGVNLQIITASALTQEAADAIVLDSHGSNPMAQIIPID